LDNKLDDNDPIVDPISQPKLMSITKENLDAVYERYKTVESLNREITSIASMIHEVRKNLVPKSDPKFDSVIIDFRVHELFYLEWLRWNSFFPEIEMPYQFDTQLEQSIRMNDIYKDLIENFDAFMRLMKDYVVFKQPEVVEKLKEVINSCLLKLKEKV